MTKKKVKNIHLQFLLLLVVSLPLALFMAYISISTISQSISNPDAIEDVKIPLSEITPPSYSLVDIVVDTDLRKFPSDYDSLISILEISLTQHQKTTLLLYGETVSKSKHTDITQAYMELLEKNIPILIPQEYINEYFNKEIDKYKESLDENIEQLDEEIIVERESFVNPYDEYLFNQLLIEFPTKDLTKISGNTLVISDFIIDTDSESINNGYYKTRILNALSVKTESLIDSLNSLVIYSESKDDINARNKLKLFLKDVILQPNLNKQGDVYWAMSVVSGKTYLYPIYISEEFVVNDNNFNDPYDVSPLAQSKNSVRVPILMYHRIEPLPTGASSFTTGLYVSPEIFEQQLAYMVKKNYKSLTSQEFYNILVTGKNPTQKSVMITFDDATKAQYTTGYPLLKKYGLVGVFYVPSAKTSITYNQLKEMSQNGMIIESHSATHIDLAKETNASRLYSEIVGSRYTLRGATGQEVITISYPGCVADKEAYAYVSQAGYLLGASCGRGIDHYFSKRLSLQRVHVFDSLDNLINLLSGKS